MIAILAIRGTHKPWYWLDTRPVKDLAVHYMTMLQCTHEDRESLPTTAHQFYALAERGGGRFSSFATHMNTGVQQYS